jgi:hypothetical protein
MWKLADRIGLEPLLVRFVAFDFRQGIAPGNVELGGAALLALSR